MINNLRASYRVIAISEIINSNYNGYQEEISCLLMRYQKHLARCKAIESFDIMRTLYKIDKL